MIRKTYRLAGGTAADYMMTDEPAVRAAADQRITNEPAVRAAADQRITNELAVRAATDQRAREKLIVVNEQNILRTASGICRRYISRSDDEWSVSLRAFSHAVDVYSDQKGDFLPFAQMLIKRKLTDYFRTEGRQNRELSVAPGVFEGDAQETEDGREEDRGVRMAVAQQCTQETNRDLAMEINAANEMLQAYGFRFFDLTECSPRQDRSRSDCARAVCAALRSSAICKKLRKTRKLPVLDLCRESGISRKTIDRYRKYIIMAILILDDDYPWLAGYLQFIRDEMKKTAACGTAGEKKIMTVNINMIPEGQGGSI